MTRARTNAPSGNPFSPGQRPPADLIPKTLRPLLAELDAINARHAQASGDLYALDQQWMVLLDAAKATDAKDSALAARAGKLDTITTKTADALIKQRDKLAAQMASVAEAVSLVSTDVHAAVDVERDNPAHAQAVEAARADLAAALEPMAAAISKAIRAQALHEWISGQHYDGGEAIPAGVLCPALVGTMNGEGIPPTPIATVLAALAAVVDN
ncbi:MAG: hypothetical protein ABI662_09485 [Dermatophilaceae bacterium]